MDRRSVLGALAAMIAGLFVGSKAEKAVAGGTDDDLSRDLARCYADGEAAIAAMPVIPADAQNIVGRMWRSISTTADGLPVFPGVHEAIVDVNGVNVPVEFVDLDSAPIARGSKLVLTKNSIDGFWMLTCVFCLGNDDADEESERWVRDHELEVKALRAANEALEANETAYRRITTK